MAMARQRAKQSNNNTKALSMASADRSVSKLLYFLKADDDDAESASGTEELKPEIDTAEFGMHERNFRKHQGKVSNARKQGKEPEWETIKTGDRKGQLSAKGSKEKDEWEAAYEYLGDIEDYKLGKKKGFKSSGYRALVQLVEIIIDKFSPALYQSLGIFLPLIAVNCSILGASLFMSSREYTFLESSVFGVSSGAGFALAIMTMAAIRFKLGYSNIPSGLKGLGITMILTGLISMAYLSFSGINL